MLAQQTQHLGVPGYQNLRELLRVVSLGFGEIRFLVLCVGGEQEQR